MTTKGEAVPFQHDDCNHRPNHCQGHIGVVLGELLDRLYRGG